MGVIRGVLRLTDGGGGETQGNDRTSPCIAFLFITNNFFLKEHHETFHPFLATRPAALHSAWALVAVHVHFFFFKLEAPFADPHCNKAFTLNAVDFNAP